jgi:hypothetical protein
MITNIKDAYMKINVQYIDSVGNAVFIGLLGSNNVVWTAELNPDNDTVNFREQVSNVIQSLVEFVNDNQHVLKEP